MTANEPDDGTEWDCIIDHEDDIDWDNIAATTEDDYLAGRYAFNGADYATPEAAMEALHAFVHRIAEEVARDAASNPTLHAPG